MKVVRMGPPNIWLCILMHLIGPAMFLGIPWAVVSLLLWLFP